MYTARYKIKQEVKMDNRRINYVSHLHITASVYKAMVKLHISPYETKQIIEAIQQGVNSANSYDEQLRREMGDA